MCASGEELVDHVFVCFVYVCIAQTLQSIWARQRGAHDYGRMTALHAQACVCCCLKCCYLQTVDELAEIAATAHNQQGEHSKAVEAACLIRSVPRRETKLELHGYWNALVTQTQVANKPGSSITPLSISFAARLSCMHGVLLDGSDAAVIRCCHIIQSGQTLCSLRQTIDHALQDHCKAARLLAEHQNITSAVTRLMQTLSPSQADQPTLHLLLDYCNRLDTPWAFQQVPAAPHH